MAKTSSKIGVVIVDDHPVYRDGLKSMLKGLRMHGIEFLGEAGNGMELLDVLAKEQPHVILMDVQMPVLDGPATCARVASLYPQVKVIALSSFGSLSIVSEMIQAGAQGYLLKTSTPGEIQKAIERVMSGKMVYAPELADLMPASPQSGEKPLLTPREREIIRYICEGKSSKEIGELLSISVRTVEGHRLHILEKIDARHFMDIVRYAVLTGIYKL